MLEDDVRDVLTTWEDVDLAALARNTKARRFMCIRQMPSAAD